ncbi:MAG TPA: glutathione S-transferase family protein [Kofleriaceae bacterium]|nr:glutathione S-transferase family protein [Kofleriaceae bacterium]
MDKLILHQPHTRPWGTPNLSPFCTKLETYLRMAEVPYEAVPADFRKAPKGKIPFVALDGELLGDSQLIIEELEQRLGDRALDAGLPPRDHATARLLRRTLEEAYYFVGMYFRWQTDDGYAVLAPEFKRVLPAPFRIAMPMIRRGTKKQLHKQGTGRHTREEVAAMGERDLAAFSELLGDRPFLFGDRPRTVDATLYAFMESTFGFPLDSPLQRAAKTHANLVAYRDRVRDRWWKDLAAS